MVKKPVLGSAPSSFMAVALLQFRLVIEGVDLRRAAGHEQPDDGLGLAVQSGSAAAASPSRGGAALAFEESSPSSFSKLVRASDPQPSPACLRKRRRREMGEIERLPQMVAWHLLKAVRFLVRSKI